MEKDDRNRSRGKPRELDISIRDPIYGQLNPLPDGTYEINISITVLVNGRPGYALFYQFIVDALPQGNRQVLTEGKASATIKLSGKKPYIAIEIGKDNVYKRYPIKDFEIAEFLPKDKGGTKSPKIQIVSQMAKNRGFCVVLALVGENGKCVLGNIGYIDADPDEEDPEPRLHTETTEENKSLSITFARNKESRKVIFFLLENPTEKVEVEIPALVQKEKKTKQQKELEKIKEEIELKKAQKDLRAIAEEKSKPKKPKIIPHICGTEGDYTVTLEVLDENESPIKDAVVKIYDQEGERRCIDLPPTDERGITTHEAKFTTKEKILTASTMGTSIWLNLFNKGGK